MPYTITYQNDLSPAFQGQVANSEPAVLISRVVEPAAGLGFGAVAMQGVNDNGVIAAVAGGIYRGVTVMDDTVPPQSPNAYPSIQYPNLIPVDTSANEWVSSITYFSLDQVGAASWFSGRAQDVPNAEVTREKFETTVSMAAIGYRYDLEELGKAQLLNQNLSSDKAAAARLAAEQFIDRVAILGDTPKGYTGLLNVPGVTTGTAMATGTLNGQTNSTLFINKTPQEVLADTNSILSGVFTGSNTVEMADTLLLPYSQLVDLSTRQLDPLSQYTILRWIEENNIYTKTTGQPLTVRGVRGLETAGAGGTARMCAYRRDPTVVKMHMPMPFQFLPVWQVGPILYEVPGIFRLGGVDVRRPGAFRYVDGI